MPKFLNMPPSFLKTVLAMADIPQSCTPRLRCSQEAGTSANQLGNYCAQARARGNAAGAGKMLPGSLGLPPLASNGFDKFLKHPKAFIPSLSSSIDLPRSRRTHKARSFARGGNANTWTRSLHGQEFQMVPPQGKTDKSENGMQLFGSVDT